MTNTVGGMEILIIKSDYNKMCWGNQNGVGALF